MIIDCLADLHGFYPKLDGGDLLIVAGDLTARDTHEEYLKFLSWLHKQKYRHYIFIAGNHDNLIEKDEILTQSLANTTYLCDSGTEFEGLRIWGSPWSLAFEGMNPHCKAFTVDTEKKLSEKWEFIPEDVDILITHSPPHGILDTIRKYGPFSHERELNVGSESLYEKLYSEKIRPLLHIYGHIHEGYGHIPKMLDMPRTQFVNASHVNENYEPVNKPIRIIL